MTGTVQVQRAKKVKKQDIHKRKGRASEGGKEDRIGKLEEQGVQSVTERRNKFRI